MHTATMEEVQSRLPEILDAMRDGEELLITRGGVGVAKLAPTSSGKQRRIAGRGKGKIIVISEDDEHLLDFQEYMP